MKKTNQNQGFLLQVVSTLLLICQALFKCLFICTSKLFKWISSTFTNHPFFPQILIEWVLFIYIDCVYAYKPLDFLVYFLIFQRFWFVSQEELINWKTRTEKIEFELRILFLDYKINSLFQKIFLFKGNLATSHLSISSIYE